MKSSIIKFILLSVFYFLIYIYTKNVFNLDKLLYSSLAEKLTTSQLQFFVESQKKWSWVSYVFTPVFLFIKSILIASVLYVGVFFYGKIKITLKQLFEVVVNAEFIFLLVGVVKIIWFYFFQTRFTLDDVQFCYPLSALNIVGYKGLEPWFIYPLQVLNLFELAYWLLLSYFVGKLAFTDKDKGKPMDLGFKIVASSYGSALLLWVVVVMFFTLNYL